MLECYSDEATLLPQGIIWYHMFAGKATGLTYIRKTCRCKFTDYSVTDVCFPKTGSSSHPKVD